MKKYIIIGLIILVASGFSFSQDVYQIQAAMELFRTNKLQSGDWKSVLTDSDIKGSPYLDDDFKNGVIFTSSKMQFVDVPLRYNIFNDNLEFKTPDDQVQAMAAPEIVEKAVFGEHEIVYIPFSDLKKIKRGFLILLEKGNVSLYLRPEVTFQEPTKPGAYKEAEPAKFIRKSDVFYIRVGLEEAKRVGTKKEILDIFPDHIEEIDTFIKKNKTKTNKTEDLIELVKFYNSI